MPVIKLDGYTTKPSTVEHFVKVEDGYAWAESPSVHIYDRDDKKIGSIYRRGGQYHVYLGNYIAMSWDVSKGDPTDFIMAGLNGYNHNPDDAYDHEHIVSE